MIAWVRRAWVQSPFRVIVLCGLWLAVIVATGLLFFHAHLPLSQQPFPDAHEYLDAANRLAHGHGFTTTVRDNPYSPHIHRAVNPPRFPPGTSLLLAPFALIGHFPGNVEFGARLLEVGLVIAVGWAAYSLAGWYAALLTALITATSQFMLVNNRIVMSDVAATVLMVVCLPLMKIGSRCAVHAWIRCGLRASGPREWCHRCRLRADRDLRMGPVASGGWCPTVRAWSGYL